jgi:hypothetical protein
MKRLSLLPLTLLFSTAAFAQTNSNDSDTLKSLLSEVRLLRHDLQTTTVAAQRAQILVYRAWHSSSHLPCCNVITAYGFAPSSTG